MGKKKNSKNKSSKKSTIGSNGPKVSILTVSQVKRIPFIHNLSKMIQHQKDVKIHEWIITNGCTTDEEHDKFNEDIKSIECTGVNIKIVAEKKLAYRYIGAFRNLANRNASGDIIICMDDDDYYFKDYVSSCVDILTKNKNVELVGCSAMLMYDYGFDTVFRLKSFGPNHTVNCCMGYRREYFDRHKYDETRPTGEERSFLDNYQSKMEQLPVMSSIIHMSYADNTFSGKRLNMLNNMLGHEQNPNQVPQIYTPINSSLKTLIKNDDIFDTYMENFKNVNMQKETDIVFYYGNMESEWSPKDKDLRVYRRKCIELGKEFIKNGFSVSVYGKFDFNDLEYEGIQFYNIKFWNVRSKTKYLIMADYTGFVPICQYQKILEKVNCEKVFIDIQCNLFNLYKHINDFNCDKVQFVLKNPYHKLMNPPDLKAKFEKKHTINDIIVPNGINLELFCKNDDIKREPKRFCYTSNYMNGLHQILKYSWPIINKAHPDAEFHIYYGLDGCSEEMKDELRKLFIQDGVYDHGRVSHKEIAKEMKRSSFLYYYTASPNDSDCISVIEALASGCIPIIWNKNVYSRFHGLLCPHPPLEESAHKTLAEKLSELLENDLERENVIKNLKNSSTIITTQQSALLYQAAFEGKTLSNEELGMDFIEPTPPPTGFDLPSNIDLSKYVDSDSDVEYESDSDKEENSKKDKQVIKEIDPKEKEINDSYEILKTLIPNHQLLQNLEYLSNPEHKNIVQIFSSNHVAVTQDDNIDKFISDYYNMVREKLSYPVLSPVELDNAIKDKFGKVRTEERPSSQPFDLPSNIDLTKYVDSDSDSDNETGEQLKTIQEE